LWQIPSGKEWATLKLKAKETNLEVAMAMSTDGKTLAAGADDGTIKLWDIVTGKEVTAISGQEGCLALAFTDGGQTLASASGVDNGIIKLWDVATGKERASFKLGRVDYPLVFSPDNKTLASGSARGLIKLWDVAEIETKRAGK
jgi:WD40 repeat protein